MAQRRPPRERLTEYRRKRTFASTPEPAGDGRPAERTAAEHTAGEHTPAKRTAAKHTAGEHTPAKRTAAEHTAKDSERATNGPRSREVAGGVALARFVVHEHHATRLHWDLRLERDGALASWAIPNGIPEDPKHNRKAIRVEDHPLDYLDFEGEIPWGQYGAGEVSVWDRGAYTCEKWRSDEVIATFAGDRLRGRYALFQAGREAKDWMIHRMDPPVDPSAEAMPELVQPMLARLSALPVDDSDWAFEVKWDGVRAIACSQPGRLHLWSRSRNEVTAAYPELRALNRALGSHSAILDGEIVALDADGRPSFELLQTRMHVRGDAVVRRLAKATPVTYVLFDLLWLDGHPLMAAPFAERRERLAELALDGERWRTPRFHVGEGEAFLAATREQGLEGVVAKRLDSRYLPGRRDGAWLKIKNARRQEAVIGGYTRGKGARAATIGALHLGVHDEAGDGSLRYAGKVGTGFDEAELQRLAGMLGELEREQSPFVGAQPPIVDRRDRRSAGGARFVEPKLVCEVEFGSWTKDGILRHSVYRGLREDKPAAEVVRERILAPPAPVRTGIGAPVWIGIGAPDRTGITAPDRTGIGARDTAAAAKGGASRPAGGRARRARHADSTHAVTPGGEAIESSLTSLLDGARKVRGGAEVECEGRRLKLTNLDKILYPNTGFSKGDLIGYHLAVAPTILTHLRGRPLTLRRYPDGVEAESFFEKHCPRHRPDWVRTATVRSESAGRDVEYCVCEDLPTLVWLANLAAIELHPSLSRANSLVRPSALAFDLDPGAPAGIVQCCRVALLLRDLFSQLSLRCHPKTSGSKGVQVYVPLNTAGVSYEQTKPFAHAVADLLERQHPQLVVSRMAKARRRGKVLIDWSQNDEHKTTVAAYSLRARRFPSASTPLDWDEVERCAASGDAALLEFDPRELPARLAERGDLFAPVESQRQRLPSLDG